MSNGRRVRPQPHATRLDGRVESLAPICPAVPRHWEAAVRARQDLTIRDAGPTIRLMTNPANPLEQSQYTQRVVAFVDILGFADLVKRADTRPTLQVAIVDALHRVRMVGAPTGDATDLRNQNFSDSLILSAANTPNGLWHLALSIDALAWNLLNLGLLVRGAITIGGLHHDDHIVFGLAVNEAYRLESTVARYPRVILSRSALAAAKKWAVEHEVWETYRTSRLRRSADGVWHLNILTELGCFSRQADVADPDGNAWYVQGKQLHAILQGMVDDTVDQPEVYAKVEWFARYWNAEVATPGAASTATLIPPVRLAGMEERGPTLPFRTS